MGKEANPEKELSKNIDKILSGQELEVDSTQSDEYRNAIDFAQKMIELRSTPRPAFQASLKARLIAKLRQSEHERRPGIFWAEFRSMLHNPVWRAVTPIVLVVVLVVGVLWGTGILPRSTGEVPAPTIAPTPVPKPSPRPATFIEVKATTGKTVYLPGEDVTVEHSVKNITQKPFEISPFPPSIRVSRAGTLVRLFPAGTVPESLQPDEVVTYALTWDQRDDKGQQVPYGYYQFVAPDIGASREVLVTILEVFISPPQGIIEKSIDLNQSQVVNEVTLTLTKVEMSRRGVKFFVIYTPPGYNFPNYDAKPGQFPSTAQVGYSLDGGLVKDAGEPVVIATSQKGLEYAWYTSDLVLIGAKELTIRITKFGDWQGPWEFRLSLQ